MNRIAATMHSPRRAARALLPLALVGLLLAPMLGQATPRAAAGTSPHSVVLVNDSGTALTSSALLSDLFHTAGPVTVAWKVAGANATGTRSHFAVALMDARGQIRARLVATTRAGRASATTDADCTDGCYLKMSIANMDYAIVGYTVTPAR
jgi:hypothetical protein